MDSNIAVTKDEAETDAQILATLLDLSIQNEQDKPPTELKEEKEKEKEGLSDESEGEVDDDGMIDCYYFEGNDNSFPISVEDFDAMVQSITEFGSFSGSGDEVSTKNVVAYQQGIIDFQNVFNDICKNRLLKVFFQKELTSEKFDTISKSKSIFDILIMIGDPTLGPCNNATSEAILSILKRFKIGRICKNELMLFRRK